MAEAFIDKDTGNGFARLDRYRASLERTYHRCARELRATRKVQNEANSTELAENKYEKLLKKMYEEPLPDALAEQLAQVRRDYVARQNAHNAANPGS